MLPVDLLLLAFVLGVMFFAGLESRAADTVATSAPPVSAVLPAAAVGASTNLSGSTFDGPIDAARSAAMMEALEDTHRLAIGDVLSLRIVEDEDEPRRLVVTDSGDLDVPYIGRFAAKGKTCKVLARELKAELEKEYYYQATVVVAVDQMARSRGRIYLVGPVRVPGPQEIPSDEVLTVSKAILRAGGFVETADRKNVRITRKGESGAEQETTITVNVAEILEKGRTEGDMVLQPGDLIYIPERLIRF